MQQNPLSASIKAPGSKIKSLLLASLCKVTVNPVVVVKLPDIKVANVNHFKIKKITKSSVLKFSIS